MIERLIAFFKQTTKETEGQIPEGLCPQCWGHQEYDNKIRELYVDKQIDVNNHKANYAFIQKFMVKHINGIKLKRGNAGMQCPTCSNTISID